MFGNQGDGQSEDGDGTDNHHDDGDHHGDDGTIDEKFRHGLVRSRGCSKRLGIDGCSVPHFLHTFHDDHLAGFNAAVDDPFRADPLADFDDADVDFVVAANDC